MPGRQLTVIPVPGHGTEDVLVGMRGEVYTGTDDGSIHRIEDDGRVITRMANTGGRPLGLEWHTDGRLLVCDADLGLLAVDLQSGRSETLVDSVEGKRLLFTNNAAVLSDGTIWFTDSSTEYDVRSWKSDLIADTRTGRLMRRDPDGAVDVVLRNLCFANGVAKSPDETFVVVAETGLCRLQRVEASGEQAGAATQFGPDLPCHPDNIALGSDGLVWVTYASPRDRTLTLLQERANPLVRSLALRLPEALKPTPKRTARVAAFDPSGALVRDLDLDAAHWHMATGVREAGGRVWLGSLVEPAVAVVDLGEL